MNTLVIENASAADYDQILQLNEAAVPNVNSIGVDLLGSLHRQALALIVARDQEKPGIVAGFLLALGKNAEYGSINFAYFNSRYSRFAYVDRIVVNPDFRRRGVGVQLYRSLFEIAGSDVPTTCEVNVLPPNPGSLSFHSGLGFSQVAEQDTEGGSKRVALLVRDAGADNSTPQ